MTDPSDLELIRQTLDGTASAYDELVRRYQTRLVGSLEHLLGSREDAEEAAQQAFVSAWKNLDSFRQDSGFYSWLYRIAVNAAHTSRRRQRLNMSSLDELRSAGRMTKDPRPAAAPDHALTSSERVRMVREALADVPEDFRRALVLRELDGLSYDEISRILDIPAGTVRSRIFRGRQELARHLQRIMADDA